MKSFLKDFWWLFLLTLLPICAGVYAMLNWQNVEIVFGQVLAFTFGCLSLLLAGVVIGIIISIAIDMED